MEGLDLCTLCLLLAHQMNRQTQTERHTHNYAYRRRKVCVGGGGIAQMQSEHHGCLDLAVFLGLRKVALSYELQQKQSFVGLPVRPRDEGTGA